MDQAIIDMQEDLVQMRQAVASAIASQKRVEQQYDKANNEANTWQQRAQLALQKGDEELARQALVRKKLRPKPPPPSRLSSIAKAPPSISSSATSLV